MHLHVAVEAMCTLDSTVDMHMSRIRIRIRWPQALPAETARVEEAACGLH